MLTSKPISSCPCPRSGALVVVGPVVLTGRWGVGLVVDPVACNEERGVVGAEVGVDFVVVVVCLVVVPEDL